MLFSICVQDSSSRLPAQRSAQYFQASLPLPRVSWPQRAISMGPQGKKMAGILAEMAPINRAGVVLSQPPMSTTPSKGWQRMVSSVSMDNRLRYNMVVGFMSISPSDITGTSAGNPPACQMPRFTSSARSRRCEWQVLRSLQVLRMPMTGLPR